MNEMKIKIKKFIENNKQVHKIIERKRKMQKINYKTKGTYIIDCKYKYSSSKITK